MQASLIKMKNSKVREYDENPKHRDPKRDKSRKKDFSKNRQAKRNYE